MENPFSDKLPRFPRICFNVGLFMINMQGPNIAHIVDRSLYVNEYAIANIIRMICPGETDEEIQQKLKQVREGGGAIFQ